jgi:hypothetical protein
MNPMRTLSTRTWLIALLVVCGATLIARQLSAEIPTVKGIGKVGVVHHITVTAVNGQLATLVQSPAAKTFVVTDVVFANAQATDAKVDLLDLAQGSPATPLLRNIPVAAKLNFDHLFGTGLEIAGGHELKVLVTGSAPVEIFVSGYFRK